ncbi:MAG: formylglycine-generating enzyme family protein [Bacteriovoracaceae bacterium]|nr:formylglycine-generating enzyme family protein [Bacteriovoracaceae bacterium]
MFKKSLCLMMLATGLTAGQASAREGGVGNGGGAWVCHNDDQTQTIRWARLVDLYEAEKEFGLSVKKFGSYGYKEIVDLQKSRLLEIDKGFFESALPYFGAVEKKIKEVDGDLEVIDDALYRMKPSYRKCLGGEVRYTQLANYTNYETILVSEYLFNSSKLSEVDKAALIVHEALYAYFRDLFKDSDSVRTRKVVGYLFSELENDEVFQKYIEILGLYDLNTLGVELVKIPAGSVISTTTTENRWGRTIEKKKEIVISESFEMMTTEVTQGMYFAVMGENPSYYNNYNHCSESIEEKVNLRTGEVVKLCPNKPVEEVTYFDVKEFITALNRKVAKPFRLPTEEEWEYAARAGSEAAYSFGDDPSLLSEYAIFRKNGNVQTHPVGPFRSYSNKTNGFGLYDMHGNVSEWTESDYGKSELHRKVIVGGSFFSAPESLDLSLRGATLKDRSYQTLGFRLVRTLDK